MDTYSDKKQQTKDTYNISVEKIAKVFSEIDPKKEDIEKTLSFISKKNPKVLELGCGNGRDANEIIKYTNDYLGIDYSEKMIEECKKNVPNGRFDIADYETFEFPKNLDVIFAFASLVHSDERNVQKILEKAYVSLNTGGVFHMLLKYGEYHEEVQNDYAGTRAFYFYKPENILEMAPKGFSQVYETLGDFRNLKWFTIILKKEY
ncbi:MAG: methyltransferase type 11 [uncultured bacterium]|nr:MAG: methyltransferase type 11 [uncultured bacterium]